jgi:hypothetical protein
VLLGGRSRPHGQAEFDVRFRGTGVRGLRIEFNLYALAAFGQPNLAVFREFQGIVAARNRNANSAPDLDKKNRLVARPVAVMDS